VLGLTDWVIPRQGGKPPGFVKFIDDQTIAIPDRPGNNRLDTLTNVLEHPGVGLIFFYSWRE
jgi:predicted pyridoxine 5'-phosphate oxidase superfamily flavin-nucleotide-binding protein